MKKISIILLIFLSSCSLFDKTEEDNDIIMVGSWLDDKIITEIQLIEETVKDWHIEDENNRFNLIRVIWWLVTDPNTIESIISYCDIYENPGNWNIVYVLWEKREWDYSIEESIIKSIREDFDWDENDREQEVKLFNWILNGEVNWKYTLLRDLDNIKLEDFWWDIELLLDYLWKYMFYIKDEKEYKKYEKYYFKQLDRISWNINENFIFPILNSQIYRYWKCKEFINRNFIMY